MIVLQKHIKTMLLVIAAFSVILFASCNKSEPEKLKLETALAVDSSFSGTRTVVCTFSDSIISKDSEQELNLDKIVQKYCPESMEYTKNIVSEQIVYSFQIKFNSASDYTQKVSDIIGLQATVNFSNPDTVLTSGWKIEENFQSSQLLDWIFEGAKLEKFYGFDFGIEETKTTASLNEDVQTSSPVISINNLKGYPIQKISIETVNKKNSVYDRTFVFTISQTTFDELGNRLSDYFRNATDNSASSAEWLLENNAYLYTVKFTDVSLKQLEGYTNNLLSSVYNDAAYEDKTSGSTPLAEQNKFRETLDFSNYVGNNNENVPVEYTYSVEGSTELSECMLYENGRWSPATDLLSTNQYGKKSAIKTSSALLTLEISDGKQYKASSINFTVTPLNDDIISKTIEFRYDIATGGNEASDYTKSYFDSKGFGAVQSVEGGENICSITFSGTAAQLNSIIPNIFGSDNLISYDEYYPTMTLRKVKQFSDHINLEDLLVGKNNDTSVNYYVVAQNGDIVKFLNSTTIISENENTDVDNDTNLSSLTKNDIGAVSIALNGTVNEVIFDVSVPEIPSIIFFCVIAFILIAAAIGAVVFMAKKKDFTSLPESEKNKLFEDKGNKLSKRERKSK